MRTSKKIVSLVLAVMMVVSMMVVGVVSASATDYVAKVGKTNFETLEDAIDFISLVTSEYHSKSGLTIKKYKADGTVTLLADCEGNGIVIDSGSNLTIDFAGHKYSVTGSLVGSNGTETIGFQLLQGSDITFKNGSLYSNKASFLVQNYSDLTLDNMDLSLRGFRTGQYTLSNNCGDVVIKNSTISAPTYSGGYEANEKGSFAFDVCRYQSYPSVTVTVEDSTINGDVEVSATGGNAMDGFKLDIKSGTMNGEVKVDDSAAAAIESSPSIAIIDQDASVVQNVAKIGDTYYAKVTEAFAAAQDGDTIDVIADSAGAGVKVLPNRFNDKGLKVDFHDHTYTIDTTLVGSVGYETQAFHLEQNNKITLQYGTITSENAKMLVQNYCDLTLKSMTLTPNNPTYQYTYYTLSNNCGNVVINNTTINANTSAKAFAFDVCRYSSYPSVNVTVKGNSVINGDVEISASGNDAKDGFSLTLEGGTMTGDIVVDASAKTAMEKAPAKTEITKKDTFTQDAPEGYKWVSNGTGASTLAPADLYAQIEGYQKKAEKASADGTGVRILTKVDKSAFTDADKYGYVVAKVTGKDQTANFANMTADGKKGEKVIDCTGTFNNGITGIDNTYVTLAVNGMSDGDQVAVRFFYVKDGVTYYAKYVNTSTYDGIIATYDAA